MGIEWKKIVQKYNLIKKNKWYHPAWSKGVLDTIQCCYQAEKDGLICKVPSEEGLAKWLYVRSLTSEEPNRWDSFDKDHREKKPWMNEASAIVRWLKEGR